MWIKSSQWALPKLPIAVVCLVRQWFDGNQESQKGLQSMPLSRIAKVSHDPSALSHWAIHHRAPCPLHLAPTMFENWTCRSTPHTLLQPLPEILDSFPFKSFFQSKIHQNPPGVLIPTLLGVAVEALLAQQLGALEVRQTLFRTGAGTDAGGREVTWWDLWWRLDDVWLNHRKTHRKMVI